MQSASFIARSDSLSLSVSMSLSLSLVCLFFLFPRQCRFRCRLNDGFVVDFLRLNAYCCFAACSSFLSLRTELRLRSRLSPTECIHLHCSLSFAFCLSLHSVICFLFLFLFQCRFRFDPANGRHSALKESSKRERACFSSSC
jgi:hypothetical protein